MPASVWQVIVATDVVDSTRLGARAGSDFWAAHDRTARDLIRACGGREIARSDGMLALFDGAAQALQFAGRYHAALAALPTALHARVGVHAGVVSLRRNSGPDRAQGALPFEVDGSVLPLAVRLQALARGGQTLASREVVVAAAAGAAVSHGFWQLKGVDEALEVFELPPAGAQPQRPVDVDKAFQVERVDGAWRPAAMGRMRLPPAQGSFVGRAELLAQIARRFDEGAPLVTLLGPGGVGKTRLALQFARAGPMYFEGGVWFCDLGTASDGDGVLQAVAQGLDVPLAGADALQVLGRAIGARGRCLLLLDNAEAVLPAMSELLPAWQRHARTARVLATSRVALDVGGESVLPVTPMPVAEACQLYVQRAQDAGATLLAEDHAGLPALVQALDGLPLALELAAARAPAMPPRQQLARLGSWRRWLGSARGCRQPARHSTLSAVFLASWELLSAAERSVLAQLTAFEGEFDLAAAEAVVDAGPHWVGDVLASLIARSLLQPAAGGRYALLRTLRDEAAEHAAALAPGVRQRHARHFAALDERQVLDGGFADLENLVGACTWAADAADGQTAVAALTLCAELLLVRGPIRRLLALAARVVALPALGAGDRAEALRVQGNALYPLGQPQAAQQAWEQGLRLATEAGDLQRQTRLGCAVAMPWLRSGRSADAQALLDHAGQLALRIADPVRQCAVANTQGALRLAASAPAEAIACFEQALALAQAAGHRRWEGGVRGNLGSALYLAGRRHEARPHFEAAHAIASEIGDRAWAANACSNLGLLLLESGHADAARSALAEALALAQEIGQAPLQAAVGCNLGLLLLQEGSHRQALAPLQDAAALAARLADHALAAQCERALARALAALEDPGAAHAALRRAAAAARQADDAAEQARCELQTAALHAAAGDCAAQQQAWAAAQQAAAALPQPTRDALAAEFAAADPRALSSRG